MAGLTVHTTILRMNKSKTKDCEMMSRPFKWKTKTLEWKMRKHKSYKKIVNWRESRSPWKRQLLRTFFWLLRSRKYDFQKNMFDTTPNKMSSKVGQAFHAVISRSSSKWLNPEKHFYFYRALNLWFCKTMQLFNKSSKQISTTFAESAQFTANVQNFKLKCLAI